MRYFTVRIGTDRRTALPLCTATTMEAYRELLGMFCYNYSDRESAERRRDEILRRRPGTQVIIVPKVCPNT